MAYQEFDLTESDTIRIVTEDGRRIAVKARHSFDFDQVKVGIEAPMDIEIVRKEIEHRYPSRKGER